MGACAPRGRRPEPGDLAAAVDITRQTINAIERDRYGPSIELVFKLAAFFECRVESLFDPGIDSDSLHD